MIPSLRDNDFGDVSVVVPAFNKEKVVVAAVQGVRNALPGAQIIIVEDGSTDGTASAIEEHLNSFAEMIHNGENRGKGFSLAAGTSISTGDIVCFFDADLDIEPQALRSGVSLLRENPEICGALGSKLHPESRVNYIWHRKVFSLLFRKVLRLFFKLKCSDTQTGIKVFRKEALATAIRLPCNDGWLFDLELIIHLEQKGCNLVEIPVQLSYSFDSTVSLKQGASALLQVISLWLDVRESGRKRLS